MVNHKIIFILLVLVLFLTSCTGTDQGEVIQKNFKQGIQEVQLSLVQNAPPPKIYPNANFKLIVEVDNQLAYEIADPRLVLTGFNDRYVQITPNPLDGQTVGDGELLGKSLTSPAGEREFVEFSGKAGSLFLNAEQHTETFFMKLSYTSKLEFSDTICINPNVYEVFDSGCKVETQKTYSGQGAPLAVTKIEEIILPGTFTELEFRIELANRGRGDVGEVRLTKALLGNDPLDCYFRGTGLDTTTVKFRADKKSHTLVCRKENLDSGRSFKTPLSLEFVYDYTMKEQQRLTLVR